MYTLRIKELRKINNMTQSELAKKLNVSHQSISKWENHITSPDISYLPILASFFDVSVDTLLGLTPLDLTYTKRSDDTSQYWDNKLTDLIAINHKAINDDYLQFLIKEVWKIQGPISVADFGAGYGYLGMKLLPQLPEGSSYTGYDFSKTLIEYGQASFDQLQLKGRFIECDLRNHSIKDSYDLVICKSFLQHHNKPEEMLRKMVEIVKPNGLLVCIEENRLIRNDGLYFDGLYDPIEKARILQTNWKSESTNDGRDYFLGFKLPQLMANLPLKDIQIRSNDNVQYIRSDSNDYPEDVQYLKRTMIWDEAFTAERIKRIHNYFQSRGLSREDIQKYIGDEMKYAHHLKQHTPTIVRTHGLFITYGRKSHEQNTTTKSELLE